MALKLKVGDSLLWNIQYKQSDEVTPVNLTGFTIDIDAYEKNTGALLFKVNSGTPTADTYISTTSLATGTFSLVIKDTSNFLVGDYLVDVEYTTADGFKQSSKSFGLKVQDRL